MITPAPTPRPGRAGSAPRAFTLVEMIVSMTIGLMVMAAVASILVMSLKMVNKNQEIDAAVGNTRSVQEHLNSELAKAISQNTPYVNRPSFSNPNAATPPRYATMVYRVPIGSYGTLQSDAPTTSNQLSVSCPADVTPQVGDYVMMDTPNLDGPSPAAPGIRITAVSGTGSVSITLASTLAAGTDDISTTTAKTGALVRIQREREYEVVAPPPSGALTTELHWYESTIDATATPPKYVVLSTHVDANNPYLFAQIPLDADSTHPAPEPSVSWQFTYVSTGTGAISQGGSANYYQSNYAEGLILPKSGNPLSASSILGGGPTMLGTSTTNVSSTTTLQSSTTTAGTSTSKSSTTTKGTSTSKSSTTTLATTTKGTSTSQSTSSSKSSTTTAGTSTSQSTSSSKSSTTTAGTSTSQSTSSSKSSTTTAGTSTSKSTTTAGTSTSKSTTTAGTSTSQSSTTTKATTTLGTSTSQSTTTAGTSTTKYSSSTTTTVPFDG